MRPPLERYQDKIVEFIHELTPLRLDDTEQRIVRQFQHGHRRGLGSRVTGVPSLVKAVQLSGTLIAWKTLCFPAQLTGVYARSQLAATRWLNAYMIFAGHCDPLISRQLVFSSTEPAMSIEHDKFWRLRAFEPNESDFEDAKHLLTNIIYYDFDKIPEWLVRETQRSVKEVPHSVTFSIEISDKPRPFPKPAPQWKPDVEADDE